MIENKNDLMNMELHDVETCIKGEIVAVRVVGGWIYYEDNPEADVLANGVFVSEGRVTC